MGKTIVTLLAIVGGFVVGIFAIVLLIGGITALTKDKVADRTVLEWHLAGSIPEQAPEDPFAAFGGGPPMTLRDYLDTLEKAESDPKVAGLIVTLGSAPVGLSQIQELREAIHSFRKKGKFAYAYSENFGGIGNYYLASAFDQIFLIPSGDVTITGMHVQSMFFRGTLEKIGVTPHMEQRYEYKNAANQYMEKKFTPAHREAMEKIGTSMFNQMVRGIAADRKMSEDEVKKLVDGAPYFGKEALAKKLVDVIAYRDEAFVKAKAKAGDGAKLLYLSKYLGRAGRPHTKGQTIALIYGVGAITQGKSQFDPLGGESSMGSDTVSAAFRQAIDDKDVKAILFRVDSPGGSAIASDAIGREVARAKKAGKPVIVSMGGVAGSGGYWVSMDADKIVASPGTITGSIGVLAGKMIAAGLFDKVGLSFDGIKYGENSTIYDAGQDFSPSELARFRAMLDFIYEDFTTKVAQGRKLPKEKVLQIAKGRIWSGEDGKELGLVDEIGGFRTALKVTKQIAKIGATDEVNLKEFPRRKTPVEALMAQIQGEQGENSESHGTDVTSQETAAQAAIRELRPLVRQLRTLGILTRKPGEVSMPELNLRY
ncbi:MAG: signal peptide peptidase SppA [Bryobacteraceae bacterium]|nr:signal peptide peptidase SppA [Bryobacteraceae bacterium]